MAYLSLKSLVGCTAQLEVRRLSFSWLLLLPGSFLKPTDWRANVIDEQGAKRCASQALKSTCCGAISGRWDWSLREEASSRSLLSTPCSPTVCCCKPYCCYETGLVTLSDLGRIPCRQAKGPKRHDLPLLLRVIAALVRSVRFKHRRWMASPFEGF